jgi:hypothetical protein
MRGILAFHLLVIVIIFLPVLPFALIVFVIAPLVVISAAAGQADGETWSEGFVCMGAMACWACASAGPGETQSRGRKNSGK